MRWTRSLIPTLREDPADAEAISHKLMVRAGLVRQLAELWQQSGRWDAIGGEMFRLKDRNQRDLCLGMTHEEVVAWIAAREIRSYRDLPQIWYQIQTKERDEARPR